MIRIKPGDELSPGLWSYSCDVHGISGVSRQPLLDACRQLQALGIDPATRVGLFRDGRSEPDYSCRLDWGADHTVEDSNHSGIRFRKFKAFDADVVRS